MGDTADDDATWLRELADWRPLSSGDEPRLRSIAAKIEQRGEVRDAGGVVTDIDAALAKFGQYTVADVVDALVVARGVIQRQAEEIARLQSELWDERDRRKG